MSSAEDESVRDLAAAYALGALSPEETREFEAYLASSPEAQREVAEYRDVAALLALAGPEAAPAEDLRERVLGRVTRQRTRSIPRRTSPLVWGALAASLLAAVWLGTTLIATRRHLAQLRGSLDSTSVLVAGLRVERDSAVKLAHNRDSTLKRIFEPGVQLFQLTASGDPDPNIQLFWDRNRNSAVLHASGLHQIDPGKAYQLWFIKDGKPVPSVTFKPEPTGHAKVEPLDVPTDGDLSAAAVTIEPETGSQQPTMPIVMVGSLTKS
jgi:anti-sigma-K factor RskA